MHRDRLKGGRPEAKARIRVPAHWPQSIAEHAAAVILSPVRHPHPQDQPARDSDCPTDERVGCTLPGAGGAIAIIRKAWTGMRKRSEALDHRMPGMATASRQEVSGPGAARGLASLKPLKLRG